ncbi:MAG: hypothetical protein U0805_04970 [Pirellulales bacterium]
MLFAVLLAYLGVSYLSGVAVMLLAIATGPFASLIVGVALLIVASRVYSKTRETTANTRDLLE